MKTIDYVLLVVLAVAGFFAWRKLSAPPAKAKSGGTAKKGDIFDRIGDLFEDVEETVEKADKALGTAEKSRAGRQALRFLGIGPTA